MQDLSTSRPAGHPSIHLSLHLPVSLSPQTPTPYILQLVSYPLPLLPYSTGWWARCPLLSLEILTSSDKPSPSCRHRPLHGSLIPSENQSKSKWLFSSASLAYRPVDPSENLASQHTHRLCIRGEILTHAPCCCIPGWRKTLKAGHKGHTCSPGTETRQS